VPAKTIRYYEDIGLILPARRSDNGYRHYGDTDVVVLLFIQRVRRLGFSVNDVADLLALLHDKERASAGVMKQSRCHVAEMDCRIA